MEERLYIVCDNLSVFKYTLQGSTSLLLQSYFTLPTLRLFFSGSGTLPDVNVVKVNGEVFDVARHSATLAFNDTSISSKEVRAGLFSLGKLVIVHTCASFFPASAVEVTNNTLVPVQVLWELTVS